MLNISIVQITVIGVITLLPLYWLADGLAEKAIPNLRKPLACRRGRLSFSYQRRTGIQRFSCFSVSQRFGCWRGGLQNI